MLLLCLINNNATDEAIWRMFLPVF